MVGNEGPIHPTHLHLEAVFDEGSTDEIVILPFEAFIASQICLEFVVQVIEVFAQVVANRACRAGLDFEYEGFAVFRFRTAVNLRSQADLVVQKKKSVMFSLRNKVLDLLSDNVSPSELLVRQHQLGFHNLAQLHENGCLLLKWSFV